MDNERLRHLQRQKEILLEHLDWINQEIDKESIASHPSPSPKASRLAEAFATDKPVANSLEIESLPQEQLASELYDQLGPDTKSAVADTKRGCLLIAGAIFALFAALCVYVVYYY